MSALLGVFKGGNMKKFNGKIIVCLLSLFVAAAMAGCGSLTSSSSGDRCPDGEVCGDGCMPTGADCCADGSGFCEDGEICNSSNQCVADGGGGGGGGGGSYTGGYTSNCYCPGDLQCSGLIWCIQTCTCYYTINGSDGTSMWYLVKKSLGDSGSCYMCRQDGLSSFCDQSTIDAAATEAAGLIAAGYCSGG